MSLSTEKNNHRGISYQLFKVNNLLKPNNKHNRRGAFSIGGRKSQIRPQKAMRGRNGRKSHMAEMALFATTRHKWLLVAFPAIFACIKETTMIMLFRRETVYAASRVRLFGENCWLFL